LRRTSPTRPVTKTPASSSPTSPSVIDISKNICTGNGNIKTLRLRCDLPSSTSSIQGNSSTCIESNYPDNVNIEVLGDTLNDISDGFRIHLWGWPALDDRTEFNISGWGTCYIDTSCSVPLVIGDKIGPFLVLNGTVAPPETPKPSKSPRRIPTPRPTRPPKVPTLTPTSKGKDPTSSPISKPLGEDICKESGKLKTLKLRYDLPSSTSSFHGESTTCVNSTYPSSDTVTVYEKPMKVRQGFQINLSGVRNLPDETEFDFATWGKCVIDTSCSVPLIVGDKIGPFVVIDGSTVPVTKAPTRRVILSPQPTTLSTAQPTAQPTSQPTAVSGSNSTLRNICVGSRKITRLQLRYQLPSATSTIQGESATCIESNYPISATLTVSGKPLEVTDGEELILRGFPSLSNKTEFDIHGWGKCHIDTSCSVPLVIGDQIGPFLVLSGSVS
jgi:hypothetical protein